MSYPHKKEKPLSDDLQQIADLLRDRRPTLERQAPQTLDSLAVQRVRRRVMSTAERPASRHSRSFISPRLTTLLTAGFLTLGTGETLALAGGNGDSSDRSSASFNQYRTECPAGSVLVNSECHNPNEQPATTASTNPPSTTPPPAVTTGTAPSSPPSKRSKVSHGHKGTKTGDGGKAHKGGRAGKRDSRRKSSRSRKRRHNRKSTHNK
jgi:hypothetical protein